MKILPGRRRDLSTAAWRQGCGIWRTTKPSPPLLLGVDTNYENFSHFDIVISVVLALQIIISHIDAQRNLKTVGF